VPVIRRSTAIVLTAAIGALFSGAIAAVAVVRSHRLETVSEQASGPLLARGPRAVVDRPHRILGVIDAPEEFAQEFAIRNEGDAPLQLTRGPSSCSCTVTNVPKEPLLPGGRAVVGVEMRARQKGDTLKVGALSRSMTVLTNDPEQPQIVLTIDATVHRRLAAEPPNISLVIQSSELSSEKARTGETIVYSQTWERFDLAVAKASRKGTTWRIEPATKKDLAPLDARSGYLVRVTVPADMPDGRFSDAVDFTVKPSGAAEKLQSLQLELHGSVDGRLTVYGRRIDANRALRLGVMQEGEGLQDFFLIKVNDEHPSLVVKRIETEPAFLRVSVAPLGSNASSTKVYRVDVQIPPDAPSCDFAGERAGSIKIKTDHPRFQEIELKVDFSVISSEGRSGHLADR
jgi:hypothetical protein